MTRAPLATTNGNFETPQGVSPSDYEFMGVFALAQTNTPAGGKSGPVATGDIKWNGTVAHARPLWNQPMMATIVNNSTSLQFIDKASLNSTPSPTTCYYPVSSWYNYYFYTYYPRVDDSKVYVSNNNVVTADYSLNGSQDIITGFSKPATDEGYCGKYFRDNSQADHPQMELTHHLAQLRFYICSKSKPQGTFQVKDIKLLEVPSEWRLTIADKSSPNNTGKLVSRNTTKTDIPVRMMSVDISDNTMTSASDDVVYENDYADDLTKVKKCAGYAMVPTTEMITTANSTLNRGFRDSLQVQIVINSNDTIKTYLRSLKANGGFVAGKVYNVVLTINQGAGGQTPEGEDPYPYIDLDLPNGLLWATINIGADPDEEDETDRALIFSWAMKTGVESSNHDQSYMVANTFTTAKAPYRSGSSWSQYNNSDHKTVLDSKDDAATQLWKYTWRMPTKEEYEYLINNTNQSWVANFNNTGISGVKFMSKQSPSKYIFFCVNGYRQGITDNNPTHGYYWSSTRGTNQNNAYCLHFYSNNGTAVVEVIQTLERRHGLSIRAVKPKQ